jgi:hypothetical protein
VATIIITAGTITIRELHASPRDRRDLLPVAMSAVFDESVHSNPGRLWVNHGRLWR